jgi:hypothetical protein
MPASSLQGRNSVISPPWKGTRGFGGYPHKEILYIDDVEIVLKKSYAFTSREYSIRGPSF